ncbi:MAG: hypothetical protein AB7P37_09285 [Ramlibacter sp.]
MSEQVHRIGLRRVVTVKGCQSMSQICFAEAEQASEKKLTRREIEASAGRQGLKASVNA